MKPEPITFARTPELLALAWAWLVPFLDARAGELITTPANTVEDAFSVVAPPEALWPVLDAAEYLRGINCFNKFRPLRGGWFLVVHDVYRLPRWPVPTYFRFDPARYGRPAGYVSPFGRFSPYSEN